MTKSELLGGTGKPLSMLRSKEKSGNEIEATQILTVKWYTDERVIRISALGDGSCFLHAYLKGFHQGYQNDPNIRKRTDMVLNLRRDLAVRLEEDDPLYRDYARGRHYDDLIKAGYNEEDALEKTYDAEEEGSITGYPYWTTVGDGKNVDLLTQEIIDPDIIKQGYDRADINAMMQDINSTKCLSDLHIIAISDIIGVDVIIFKGYTENLSYHMTTYKEGRNRPIVCVVYTPGHYELIGTVKETGIKTSFEKGDPFIDALFNIQTPEFFYIHRPEDIYIEAIIRNYKDYDLMKEDGGITITDPTRVTELKDNDPYVMMLYSAFESPPQQDITLTSEEVSMYKEYLSKLGFILEEIA